MSCQLSDVSAYIETLGRELEGVVRSVKPSETRPELSWVTSLSSWTYDTGFGGDKVKLGNVQSMKGPHENQVR